MCMKRGACHIKFLLGSTDHRYCILLGLGFYLKLWMSGEGQHSNHIFVGQTETPKQVKDSCSSAMKTYVFDLPDFIKVDDQPIKTHSLCKLLGTFAMRNNCTQEEIKMCGQWLPQGACVSMRYVSTLLPYQDAKVASKLCMGGPVKYALQDGNNITQAWLLEYVVPNI